MPKRSIIMCIEVSIYIYECIIIYIHVCNCTDTCTLVCIAIICYNHYLCMYFYVHINRMPETCECTDILYLGPKRNHPKKEGQQKLQSKLPLSSKVKDLQNSVSLRKDPVRKSLCRPLTQSKAPGWRHVFLLHYRISESFKPWFRR